MFYSIGNEEKPIFFLFSFGSCYNLLVIFVFFLLRISGFLITHIKPTVAKVLLSNFKIYN